MKEEEVEKFFWREKIIESTNGYLDKMAKQGIFSVMMNIEMEFCFDFFFNNIKWDPMLEQSLKAAFFEPNHQSHEKVARTKYMR